MNLFPHIIVGQTYKCYAWSSDDLEKNNQGGWSAQNEKTTCEEYGYIYSQGDENKAPGCGGCWCCQPKSISGKYKYI